MSDPRVRFSVEGTTATLVLDSDADRNALSRALCRELSEALRAALHDDDVRVVVLSHSGSVFCSGMDLRASDPPASVREFAGLLEELWTARKPVIARVAGAARGGGLGLLAACDLALAAEDAAFAFSEVRLGVVPAVVAMTVLPRLSARAAQELLLTGEVFDARRAAAVGLVSHAVPSHDLDAEVGRYAGLLTLGAPGALAATKDLLRSWAEGPAPPTFASMVALSGRHFSSTEGQEGVRAFLERRPPAWVADDAAR